MLQIGHSSLIAIHLTAVAMLMAVLFCTLWLTLRQLEIKRENFSLFLTDAAWYMLLFGWKDIKGIILFFDACHLRCALTT